WISCDPAGLAGGMNLYAYSGGNPIRFVDATGKQAAEVNQGLDYTYHEGNADVTRYAAENYESPHVNFTEPLEITIPPKTHNKTIKQPPPPPPKTESQRPEGDGTPGPPAASAEEAAGAFAKGAAKGLAAGIATELGVGFVAGLTGVAAGTLGVGLLVV